MFRSKQHTNLVATKGKDALKSKQAPSSLSLESLLAVATFLS